MYSKLKEAKMLAIRLPEEIDVRLSALSKKTGRTKTFYAREALINYMQDMEDYYLAMDRLNNPSKTISLEELIAKRDKA